MFKRLSLSLLLVTSLFIGNPLQAMEEGLSDQEFTDNHIGKQEVDDEEFNDMLSDTEDEDASEAEKQEIQLTEKQAKEEFALLLAHKLGYTLETVLQNGSRSSANSRKKEAKSEKRAISTPEENISQNGTVKRFYDRIASLPSNSLWAIKWVKSFFVSSAQENQSNSDDDYINEGKQEVDEVEFTGERPESLPDEECVAQAYLDRAEESGDQELHQTIEENRKTLGSSRSDTIKERQRKTQKEQCSGNQFAQIYIPSESEVVRMESVLRHAPEDILSLIEYLKDPSFLGGIDDFRETLFVGPPGTAKSILSKAIAYKAGRICFFVQTGRLLRNSRNKASMNIITLINEVVATGQPSVLILDEFDNLTEKYKSEHTDSKQTASTLWQEVDAQRENHKFFLICITNDAKEMPKPFQDRFGDNYIEILLPDEQARKDIFLEMLEQLTGVKLHESCNDEFFSELVKKMDDFSQRNIKGIISRAIFFYRRHSRLSKDIILTPQHFKAAVGYMEHGKQHVFDFHRKEESDEDRRHRESMGLQRKGLELQREGLEQQKEESEKTRDQAKELTARNEEHAWDILEQQEDHTWSLAKKSETFTQKQRDETVAEECAQSAGNGLPLIGGLGGAAAKQAIHKTNKDSRGLQQYQSERQRVKKQQQQEYRRALSRQHREQLLGQQNGQQQEQVRDLRWTSGNLSS